MSETKIQITDGRHIQLRAWAQRLRDSKTFGCGSCTTVDEAMEWDELIEALHEYSSFGEAWTALCDIEEMHWEVCGIHWKRPEKVE